MYTHDKIPSASQELFIKDMEQACSEAALVRKPIDRSTGKEYDKCSYAFFPGCQLAGAEPEIVVKVYDSLLFQHPDTAIFLRCCGAPSAWAQDNGVSSEILSDVRQEWENLGKPTMIMACMSCCRIFRENLPEIPAITLYEMLDDLQISGGCNTVDYILFTPSSAHDDDKVIDAVSKLADSMGATLHPPCENTVYTGCCLCDECTDTVSAAGDYPFITYCISCRDMLKKSARDAVHILELIYGMGDSNQHIKHEHKHDHGHEDHDDHEDETPAVSSPLPTPEERRRNRMELKQALLSLFWDEFIEI